MRRYASIGFLFLLALFFYRDVFISGLYIVTGDNFAYNYPMRGLLYGMLEYGELPLWNPRMFTGMPFLGAMQTGACYPLNYVFYLIPMPYSFTLSLILHTFMASAFMYMFARLLTGKDAASAVAGAVYGYAGFMRSYIHVSPVLYTAAWLPLLLYFAEKIRSTGERRYIFMGGLSVMMQALAGHPQTLFYSLLCVSIYGLAHSAFMDSRRQGLGFVLSLGLMIVSGLVFAMPQLWATYELSQNALRAKISYDVFSQMSFHPLMFADMFFRGAWTPPPGAASNEGFIGILPLALGVSSAIAFWMRSVHARVLGIVALASLILALGAYIPPLYRALYHLPGFNLFRAPMRHLMEADFALIGLFSIGLSSISDGDKRLIRTSGIALCAIAALGLAVAIFKGEFSAVLLIPAAVCFLYALIMFFRARTIKMPVIGLLLLVFSSEAVRHGWLSPEWPGNGAIETRLESGLYSRISESGGRTAFTSLTGNTDHLLLVTTGAELLGGYDPLIPGSISDLLDMEGIGYSHSWGDLISYNRLLSMLNVRHLVVPASDARLAESVMGRLTPEGRLAPPFGPGFPASGGYARVYEKALDTGSDIVYENLAVLPRAYPVGRLRQVKDAAEAASLIAAMRSEPSEEALLSPSDIEEIGKARFSGRGAAVVKSRSFNTLTIESDLDGEGFIVVSELFYPGWQADIDGEDTEIFRANGAMRGVVAPGGRHLIEFKYRPGWLLPSAIASSVAIFLCALWSFGRRMTKASPNP